MEQSQLYDGAAPQTGKRQLLCDPRSLTSGVLHFLGMLGSIATLVILVYLAQDAWRIVSFSIYGASATLLFAASGVFHTFYVSPRVHRVLRKIDHSMIYFLIAGTYTPLCLVTLHGWIGWTLFGIIWAMAIAGIVLKIGWIEKAPRRLSTYSYILMGWAAVIAIIPLAQALPLEGMLWLFGGGVIYTVGGIAYNRQIPKFKNKYFGDHEFFHILILLGWFCHFMLMLRCVL